LPKNKERCSVAHTGRGAVISSTTMVRKHVCYYLQRNRVTPPNTIHFLSVTGNNDAWTVLVFKERWKVTANGKIIRLEDNYASQETVLAVVVACPQCGKGAQVRKGEYVNYHLSCPFCSYTVQEAAVYIAEGRECWSDWLRAAYPLFQD
jgi:hypothetical protein